MRGGPAIAVWMLGCTAALAQTTVPGGTISTDTTWTLAGSPYTVTGNVAVVGTDGPDGITTLTIEPGVEVRFNSSIQLQIGGTVTGSPGAILADGSAAGGPARIVFTSSSGSPAPGSWSGLYFRAGARASTLRNARVEYGGGGGWAGIQVSSAASTVVTLDDVEIRNNANEGLNVAGPVTLAVSGCSFSSNALDDVALANSAAITGSVVGSTIGSVGYSGASPAVDWSANSFVSWGTRVSRISPNEIADFADDNVFTKIPSATVSVLGGTVSLDGTWTAAMADAYVLTGNVAIAGSDGGDGITTLTLEPGVALRFNASVQLQVGGTTTGSPGALVADGNAGGGPARILFTSSSGSPGPGSWSGIYLRAGARSSSLRNARVEYGGGGGWAGIYASASASTVLTLDDVEIASNANEGLNAAGAVTLAVAGCSFSSNALDDVAIANSASLTGSVTGSTLTSVGYSGGQPHVSWSGNAFTSWGQRVSRIPANAIGDFASDNTFAKVQGALVNVLGDTISLDATWTTAMADAYVAVGSPIVAGTDGGDGITTLTLEPGVEIRFNASVQLQVGGTLTSQPGALVADGNAAGGPARIVLTSSSATPSRGSWNGVYFRVGARPSILRNARVDWAGAGGWAGVYLGQPAGNLVTIDDVIVTQSGNYGVYQSGPATMSALTITGTDSYGVYVASGALSLSTCDLDSGASHDVYLSASASITGTVQNCTGIRSVFYAGEQPSVSWTGNQFLDWGQRVSRIEPDAVRDFLTSNTVSLAPAASVELTGGTVARDATWTSGLGNPYVATGFVDVAGTDGPDGITTVTIAPGLEMRFAASTQLRVGGTSAGTPGALVADGNGPGGPARITFTSSSPSPAPGAWIGLYFRPGARSSTLRNARVDYGGAGGWAGVYLTHAAGNTVTIDDVIVTQSANYGIYQSGDAVLSAVTVLGTGSNAVRIAGGSTSLSNCALDSGADHDLYFANIASIVGSIQNCSAIHSVYYAGESPDLSWSGNTFVDWGARVSRVEPEDVQDLLDDNTVGLAPGATLELTSGTVVSDALWTPGLGNPYVALGATTVVGSDGPDGITTLILAPGLEIRFQPSTQLLVGGAVVGSPGALVADGNAAGGPSRIVLTSSSPTPAPGAWSGVYLRPGARTSLLRNARVAYAGSGGWAGIYDTHVTGTVTLDDVEITSSGNTGMFAGGGAISIAGCLFEDNGDHDLSLQNAAAVTGSVAGSTLESVFYGGNLPDVSWTGNTFESWGARTSRVSLASAGPFSTANVFHAVPGAVLDVWGGTLAEDATWSPTPGPYVLTTNLTVQGTSGADGRTTLTLEPGATLRFPTNGTLLVGGSSGNPGELIASGQLGGGAVSVVNFGSSQAVPTAGSWNGIEVRATGRASLQDVQVRHAATALSVTSGTLDLLERLVANRCNVGVDLDGSSPATTLSELTIRNTDTAVRTTSSAATIRASNLEGTTWGVRNLSPASFCVDAQDNWWGSPSGPIGPAPAVGCATQQATGTGSAITEGVLFGAFLPAPSDDLDGIDCDDGDGFADPCSGGNTVDCDDNCCNVANASQADEDGDGVGDACDGNPILRVSSDPLDLADFAVVQDAVDAAFQSGTRIEIYPGLGPYVESVRLDREQVFTIVGLDEPSGDPVIVDGLTGPAFDALNKVGVVPMDFSNLTFRGDQGVHALVDTAIRRAVFDGIAHEALKLDAGSHTLVDVAIGPSQSVGADVDALASLSMERVSILGSTDAGIVADGAVTAVSSLVAGGNGADGVRLGPAGSATLRFTTVADNTGYGVDNAAGGGLVLDRSIVWGNALDDLAVSACGSVSWSDVGVPDCSASGNNLSADPLLDAAYRLTAGSPCLDHGPDPATFTGTPVSDLDSTPRLKDYDGDGIATSDCGAFEAADPSLVPGEVQGVQWTSNFRLTWDPEPSAVEYHVYRDLRSNLSWSSFAVCADGLDGNRTDTMLDDLAVPASGQTFVYLITAEAGNGREGTLGHTKAAERSNFPANRCP